jgi:hypothetical protein
LTVFNAGVGAGEWLVSVPQKKSPAIRFDHTGGEALAVVMGMG